MSIEESRKRKTEDVWTLQGNYGQGWEDLTSEKSRKEILARKREYEQNEGGNYKIVMKRERIQESELSDLLKLAGLSEDFDIAANRQKRDDSVLNKQMADEVVMDDYTEEDVLIDPEQEYDTVGDDVVDYDQEDDDFFKSYQFNRKTQHIEEGGNFNAEDWVRRHPSAAEILDKLRKTGKATHHGYEISNGKGGPIATSADRLDLINSTSGTIDEVLNKIEYQTYKKNYVKGGENKDDFYVGVRVRKAPDGKYIPYYPDGKPGVKRGIETDSDSIKSPVSKSISGSSNDEFEDDYDDFSDDVSGFTKLAYKESVEEQSTDEEDNDVSDSEEDDVSECYESNSPNSQLNHILKLAGLKESDDVSLDDDFESSPKYEINTWFERDRAHVSLEKDGETVVEWWDDDVQQAVEDGYLNPRDWLGSAMEYAKEMGLIGIDESAEFNGYDTQNVYHVNDTFPRGNHGSVTNAKGPASAKYGDNPLQSKMAVSESLEQIKRKLSEDLKKFKK